MNRYIYICTDLSSDMWSNYALRGTGTGHRNGGRVLSIYGHLYLERTIHTSIDIDIDIDMDINIDRSMDR